MNKDTEVYYLMTKQVTVASTGHKFSEVQRFFVETGIHHLPVVDHGELVGILSVNDVIAYYAEHFHEITNPTKESLDKEFSIYSMMTKNPMTVTPRDTIGQAAQIFNTKKFHALPVVENGNLVGIITSNDLVRYMAVETSM